MLITSSLSFSISYAAVAEKLKTYGDFGIPSILHSKTRTEIWEESKQKFFR